MGLEETCGIQKGAWGWKRPVGSKKGHEAGRGQWGPERTMELEEASGIQKGPWASCTSTDACFILALMDSLRAMERPFMLGGTKPPLRQSLRSIPSSCLADGLAFSNESLALTVFTSLCELHLIPFLTPQGCQPHCCPTLGRTHMRFPPCSCDLCVE